MGISSTCQVSACMPNVSSGVTCRGDEVYTMYMYAARGNLIQVHCYGYCATSFLCSRDLNVAFQLLHNQVALTAQHEKSVKYGEQ